MNIVAMVSQSLTHAHAPFQHARRVLLHYAKTEGCNKQVEECLGDGRECLVSMAWLKDTSSYQRWHVASCQAHSVPSACVQKDHSFALH